MQVDYNSKESVISVMKQSGLPKFKIQKAGAQKNSTPIFDSLSTTNNAGAIERFEQWANIIDNSNAYEMILFTDENNINEDPNAKGKRAKVLRFSFSLNGYSNQNKQVVVNGNNNLSTSEIVKQVVQQINQANNENAVLTGLAAINKRLDEYEEEEEEEDEPAPAYNVDKIMLGIHGILDKINDLRQPVKKVAEISGPVDNNDTDKSKKSAPKLSEEDLAKLNEAINILRHADKDIAKNIMTLALLARDNNATYQMGINYLESMNKKKKK